MKRLISARRSGGASGFSLVEAITALGLLAITLIGILPLFTRALTSNYEGGQFTEVTSRARQHLEELMALPFDSPRLVVPNGDSELVVVDLWSPSLGRWVDEESLPAGEQPDFTRSTRVRQFSASAVASGDTEFADDEALAGGTASNLVDLKQIEVHVATGQAGSSNILGRRKAVTLRVLKSA